MHHIISFRHIVNVREGRFASDLFFITFSYNDPDTKETERAVKKEEKIMRKGLTEVVFILDRSGSMSGLEADTIGGFNSMLEKQKKEDGEAIVSTVLFDDKTEILHDRKDMKKVEAITDKEYYVRGCTALLDAVGGAIHHIGSMQKAASEDEKPEKTLFIITTDGMENASKKYSYDKVKKMVEKKKKKGWEFVFLGANIDAIAVANRFGVAANRAVRFENDGMGAELNYRVMSDVVSAARRSKSMLGCAGAFDTLLDDVREDYEEFEEASRSKSQMKAVSAEEKEKIIKAMSILSPKEQEMAKVLFGIECEQAHSYEEAGRRFHTSEGRIRQAEAKIRRKVGQSC